jgi:hypothetical protein
MPAEPRPSSDPDQSETSPDEPTGEAADDAQGHSFDELGDAPADDESDDPPRRTRTVVTILHGDGQPLGSTELTGLKGVLPPLCTGRIISDVVMGTMSSAIAPHFEGLPLGESASKLIGQAVSTGLFDTEWMKATGLAQQSLIPLGLNEASTPMLTPAMDATAWMKDVSGLTGAGSAMRGLYTNVPGLTGVGSAMRGLYTNVPGLTGVGSPVHGLFTDAQIESMMPAFKLPDLGSLIQLPPFIFDFDFSGFADALKLRRVTPNWLDVAADPDAIEAQIHAVLADGIPLGWVPGATVIDKLLQAADGSARRRVISNNWRGILNDCEVVAGALPSRRALFLADMIRRAIAALRDRHTEAAQALATNVLDTVISQFRVPNLNLDKGTILNPDQRKKLAAHGWRFAFSLLPAHATMTGKYGVGHRGTAFHRNVTAHAATRRQYNRINAVIAIMLASSVLACAVTDTSTFD